MWFTTLELRYHLLKNIAFLPLKKMTTLNTLVRFIFIKRVHFLVSGSEDAARCRQNLSMIFYFVSGLHFWTVICACVFLCLRLGCSLGRIQKFRNVSQPRYSPFQLCSPLRGMVGSGGTKGGLRNLSPPTIHQDQSSNSSKFDEEIGLEQGTSSTILKWVW